VVSGGGNPGRKEICLASFEWLRSGRSSANLGQDKAQEIKSKRGLNSIEEFDDLKAWFRQKAFWLLSFGPKKWQKKRKVGSKSIGMSPVSSKRNQFSFGFKTLYYLRN